MLDLLYDVPVLQLPFTARSFVVSRNVPGVPDISEWWYRDVAGMGAASPAFFQGFGAIATHGIIVTFVLLLAYLLWRSRPEPVEVVSRAALALPVVLLAYLISDVLKGFIQEDRPCRAVGRIATIDRCPDVGDWSFPSNHAVLAGSAAVALICLRRTWTWLAVVLALATAFSRVYVGVHYPHDVLVGLLLGGSVAAALPLLARKAEPFVAAVRARPAGELLLGPPAAGDEPLVPDPRVPANDGTTRDMPVVDMGEPPTARIPRVGAPEAPTARLPRVR